MMIYYRNTFLQSVLDKEVLFQFLQKKYWNLKNTLKFRINFSLKQNIERVSLPMKY